MIQKVQLPMESTAFNILFLCTHNSARSILAEALMNHMGGGKFKAFSAGSSPSEHQRPNPFALKVLSRVGISTEGLRSKNWDEFSTPGAPKMHLIITVCDNAAGEVCPFWPGQPATAHWGYPDPSHTQGSDEQKEYSFSQTMTHMRRRLELLMKLPLASSDKLALQTKARELAKL